MSDRPLECSQCKKCADVLYTEIVEHSAMTIEMCQDCPILKQKLEGDSPSRKVVEEELCCSHCHTSLDSVLVGGPLGCQECYGVFQDILVDQLLKTKLVSPQLQINLVKPIDTLHVGKKPSTDKTSQQISRIRDLNEALSIALERENYEEAAAIRDQINALTQASNDST